MMKIKCSGLNNNFLGIVKNNDNYFYLKDFYPNEEGIYDESLKQITKLTKKSENRSKFTCPNYLRCGGCSCLTYDYKMQLDHKKDYVLSLFKKNNIKINKFDGILGMNNPLNYRHKIIASFKQSKSNKLVLGLYEESTHKVIPYEKCLLQNNRANEILKDILEIANKLKLQAADDKRGFLKHVLLRIGYKSKEVLVCIITKDEFFPGRKEFLKELLSKNKDIKTVVQNYNFRDTSVVLGEKEKVLYGLGYITDYIDKYQFRISSKSFYQVNPEQMINLYNKAIEIADLKPKYNVLDAYSGISTISILASKKCNMVISCENNKMAYMDAKKNGLLNHINNIDFVNMDATNFINDCYLNKVFFDCIFMDPPREGSTNKFLKNLIKINPKKIVYISCNPETLVRDINVLKDNYNVLYLKLYDMFPMTNHVETLCLLSRK